ncbi:TorD/DmsD family molecular chaperone [Desulfosoma sp.]
MRHNGAHHQGLRLLDKEKAVVLAPVLSWAKTAARYPKTADHMEALLEHSEPLVHWLPQSLPLFQDLLAGWIEAPEATLEAHQVDYTRLFVARWGGVPAPLYASWYLDQETFCGDGAEASVGFYERWGLVWRETTLKEPPDHLAVELEFLEILSRAVSEAPADGAQERLPPSALWLDFRLSHFDRWVPRCAEIMGRHAAQPVYKILALSLTQLCEED